MDFSAAPNLDGFAFPVKGEVNLSWDSSELQDFLDNY
jgi:hypothetical protein